jgi:hypothetical protein
MPMNNDQVPIMYHSTVPGGNPVHAILGEHGQAAIRSNIAGWQFNLWDGAGWQLCPNQAEWHVPFSCRGIYMHRVSGETTYTDAVIEMDEIGYGAEWGNGATRYQKHIVNTLTTRTRHQCCVHSVYLAGSSSTFTEIYFSA